MIIKEDIMNAVTVSEISYVTKYGLITFVSGSLMKVTGICFINEQALAWK